MEWFFIWKREQPIYVMVRNLFVVFSKVTYSSRTNPQSAYRRLSLIKQQLSSRAFWILAEFKFRPLRSLYTKSDHDL